jgi:hypothetical protein
MDEGRGLQRVPGLLRIHQVGGEPAEFSINQRQQLLRSRAITTFRALENAGEFTHE